MMRCNVNCRGRVSEGTHEYVLCCIVCVLVVWLAAVVVGCVSAVR